MSERIQFENEQNEYTVEKPILSDQNQEPTTYSVEDLLWVYIGHDANKYSPIIESVIDPQLKKRSTSFNAMAFFLPLLWFFYRKLYLAGIIASLAIPIIVGYIFPDLPNIVYLSLSFAIGYNANHFYVASAKKKIEKVMREGLSQEELKHKVQKMGGTSIPAACFGGITMLSLIAISVMDTNIELPNCAHMSSHGLLKQVIINNHKGPLSSDAIKIVQSKEIERVDNRSYLCRYQVQLRGERAWFKAKIYWFNPQVGRFGLELIPEKNP